MSFYIKQQFIKYNNPDEGFINLKGIVIHSTANIGATAQNHYNYWNSGDKQSSVHYIADWISDYILQLIPEDHIAWHVGAWQGNREWLGIEMCETNNSAQFEIVWNKTVWFIADVCIRYNWNVNDNVWTHRGMQSLYKGVDHTDPYPYFQRMGRTWQQLCEAIDSEIKRRKQQTQPSPPSPTSTLTTEIYRVKVNAIQVGAFGVKDSAFILAKLEYDKASVGTRITIEQKSDGQIIFDQTKAPIIVSPSIPKTSILGTETITVEQCNQFIRKINPNALDIVHIYKKYGEILGIKWGYSVAQMIKETSYLRYGGDVLLSQNNYAGIGAVGQGAKGAYFNSPDEGVLAHLEHLFAYASKNSLPSNLAKVDPRYDLVVRGIAPNWEDLNGRWAVPGNNYGQEIVQIYNAITKEIVPKKSGKIIFSLYEPDARAAMYLSDFTKIKAVDIKEMNDDIFSSYEEIIQIGGQKYNENVTLHLAGNTRYDTLLKVLKHMKLI